MCLVPRAVSSVRRYEVTKSEAERCEEKEKERERKGKGSRREKDELRRFRRRIKRKENILVEERIRNVGRWSAKKRRGSRAQKITPARVHNPVPSVETILPIPTKVCDLAFRDDLMPRNVDTRSVWRGSPCVCAVKVSVERHSLVL